jgi:uncharacterized RDD family membrane protein YckC
MYCSRCGREIDSDTQFCIHCGNNLSRNPVMERKPDSAVIGVSQPVTQDQQKEVVPQIRPWVRFFARIIDIWLTQFLLLGILVFLGITLVILDPRSGQAFINAFSNIDPTLDMIFTFMVSLLVLALIEPFFLSNFGYTPGKWLLQTRVVNPDGTNLTFSQAMNRSLSVYIRGFLLGIPFFSLITLLIESSKLEKEGKTTWDRNGGHVILHNRIGVPRTIAAIILLVTIRVIMLFFSDLG